MDGITYDRDEDDYSEDDFDPDSTCLVCGGDDMVENYDLIQRGGGDFVRCYSCGGSGKRKDMTIW